MICALYKDMDNSSVVYGTFQLENDSALADSACLLAL